MDNIKSKIKELKLEKQAVKDTYEYELNKKEQEWRKLGNFVHGEIEKIEEKEKELYQAWLIDVVMNDKIDFTKIIELIVE